MCIVGERQLLTESVFVELILLFKGKRIGCEKAWGGEAIQCRGDGNGQDIDFAEHQGVQRAQALRNQILVRGKAVIRQCFPVR